MRACVISKEGTNRNKRLHPIFQSLPNLFTFRPPRGSVCAPTLQKLDFKGPPRLNCFTGLDSLLIRAAPHSLCTLLSVRSTTRGKHFISTSKSAKYIIYIHAQTQTRKPVREHTCCRNNSLTRKQPSQQNRPTQIKLFNIRNPMTPKQTVRGEL